MAGRKQFDVEAARDAVMTTFWQRGYAETSLDDIGTATGLGKGSLYGTFGTKQDLYRAALDRYAETYGEHYERALGEQASDPVQAVKAFFDVVLARMADPSLPDGCLIALSAAFAPTLDDSNRDHVKALLGRQRQRVRDALSRSSITASEADDLALFIVSTNQGLAVMHRAGAKLEELQVIARTAVQAVQRALPDDGGANGGHPPLADPDAGCQEPQPTRRPIRKTG
jgi:AcrR family transcriptional regulator